VQRGSEVSQLTTETTRADGPTMPARGGTSATWANATVGRPEARKSLTKNPFESTLSEPSKRTTGPATPFQRA